MNQRKRVTEREKKRIHFLNIVVVCKLNALLSFRLEKITSQRRIAKLNGTHYLGNVRSHLCTLFRVLNAPETMVMHLEMHLNAIISI